jgi:uncharacterized protein
MQYNVAQLMKAQVGASLESNIYEDNVQLDTDFKVISPIIGHVRMRRTNQGLLVDGRVDLTVELTCNRCLEQFEQPLHILFTEQFFPTVDVVSGIPLPSFDEDEIFPIDDHHHVDLTEAIRQHVLLELPMSAICREDCAGLCPQCGHNLNLGPCKCQPEVDQRFNVLQQLLQNGTSEL